MGWNADDEHLVVEAQIGVSLTRCELYKVFGCVKNIKHPEKGPILTSLVKKIYDQLDVLDAQLKR